MALYYAFTSYALEQKGSLNEAIDHSRKQLEIRQKSIGWPDTATPSIV
jgi:hypothetical protein